MKVIHLLATGGAGGIETLMKDFSCYSIHDNIFVFVWQGGCVTEEMKADNKSVIELHTSNKNIVRSLKKILMLCKDENVDTIVVHHAAPIMHLYAMCVKKRYPSKRVIVYAHGNAVDMCRINIKRGLWLRRRIINQSLYKADRIVAISKSVKNSLVEYYKVSEEKISIVYNGVDINRFEDASHRLHKKTEIIYVGRLIEQKGVQNTLQAMAALPKDLEYRFRIIGDGTYRDELEQLTKKLGLEHKVEFLGTRRDVSELLNGADIFVHAPVWEEGFGITIVEAMASGLVCICNNSGAIPEIIEEGENGYLVEKGNIGALTERLCSVLGETNIEKVQTIQQNARVRASAFSSKKFAQNLDFVIESNVKENGVV